MAQHSWQHVATKQSTENICSLGMGLATTDTRGLCKTRYLNCDMFASVSRTAEVAADALVEWAKRYGLPTVLISDQGSNFRNETMRTLCDRIKIEQRLVPSYMTWLNGTIECLTSDARSTDSTSSIIVNGIPTSHRAKCA
ncbi:TPA: hypothetical protein N0F65_005298 [Lagenidium giganteum]|uniref:Integrase catalytic domain-containing protein n=1 Tax=Lagenidium giganteum TaxID=4803 RepID=A0AAV2Z1P1_9STRA|nr:TPA: hypothetical protein N0F65_005298 [Lagenidium giganteum]